MEPKFFTSRAEFRNWLEERHDTADELWVGYYKKDAEKTGISYGESVEEAICFGWIDGLIHGIDDETYKRRFTPRKPDSKWSKINKERVETMIEAKKMTSAGLELVEAAKESGEWEDAYRVGEDHDVPSELKNALQRNETAWTNFQNFSNTDQHVYITLFEDAKTTETKEQRITKIVELAANNLPPYDDDAEKYHLYMTNLPVADYSAADIAQLYRARWEVELLFKELKSTYNLDQIPTSNPVAVETLILVALISLVVSRVLLDLLREVIDREAAHEDGSERSPRILYRRWSRVFSRYGGLILRRVAQYLGYDPPEENLLELLLAAAIDPNPHRPSLIEDVQHGAFVRELA